MTRRFSMLKGCLFLKNVLTLLLLPAVYVSSETLHISPTVNATCLEDGISCVTLSQYANQTIQGNLSSDIELNLILQPGNHSFDTNLTISNIASLTINAFNDKHITQVFCHQAGMNFVFLNITKVHISGIVFVGCINVLEIVENFTLNQCQLEGRESFGSRLELLSVSSATIYNSQFRSNSFVILDSDIFGGALFINTSKYVSIERSSFGHNYAFSGSCVYALESEVYVLDSIFANNTAVFLGGAIAILSGSTLTVDQSVFTDNSVERGANVSLLPFSLGGGAINMFNGKNLNVIDSTFIRNSVEGNESLVIGGAILIYRVQGNLTIDNSVFIRNQASYGLGAVGAIQSNRIDITNSTFRENVAATELSVPISGGGALGATFCEVVFVRDCNFVDNSTPQGGGGGIGLDHITRATIERCSFLSNSATISGGAISCVRESRCTVDQCDFQHNEAFSFSGGALFCETCFIMILNSNFSNNTAVESFGGALSIFGALSATTIHVLSGSKFVNNRANFGGAINLGTVLISINDSHFDNNQGNQGIFYCAYSIVSFTGKNSFSSNTGMSLLSFNSNITFEGNLKVFNNSIPSINTSLSFIIGRGGTLTFYQSIAHFMEESTISNNKADEGGAIFSTESAIIISGNTTILNNIALFRGGGIYVHNSLIQFMQGVTNIAENEAQFGGGILALGSSVVVSCSLFLIGNRAFDKGGGLYLESLANILIRKYTPECYAIHGHSKRSMCEYDTTKWIRVEFTGNSAAYGGAIFVNDYTSPGVCSVDPMANMFESINGECFFQSLFGYDTAQLFIEIVQDFELNFLNIYFSENMATVSGDDLFGGLLDRCELSLLAEILLRNSPNFLDPSVSHIDSSVNINASTYITTTTNIDLDRVSSEPVRICFCKDNQPDCDFQPSPVSVRNGESFSMSAIALDHLGHVMPNGNSTIKSYFSFNDSSVRHPGQVESNCTTLSYQIVVPEGVKNTTVRLASEGPCGDRGTLSTESFEVNFLECPIGFAEVGSDSGCDCDRIIRNYVTDCSIDTELITKIGNSWISFENGTENRAYYLTASICPFDYCKSAHSGNKSFHLNFPDSQCNFNRSGVLCGRCSDGQSLLLGTSRCGKCTNSGLALIIVFALAGIALVYFTLVLNLTVAVGSMNGLIFYANIILVNKATFFPPDSLIKGRNLISKVFLAWLNLDFGFETCFYDGMDEYAKAWLQLVFPIYIILLVIAVVVLCEYSPRFASVISTKNPVATLESLLLLSYTKLMRLIVYGMGFSQVRHSSVNGSLNETSVKIVWRADGNLDYFGSKHIPLYIVTILLGVILVFVIVLGLFWPCLQRCRIKPLAKIFSNTRFNSFIDAFHAPFKREHRYWVGLLLATRLVLYTLSAVYTDPKVNLWVINLTTGILLTLSNFTGGGLYKKWPLNTLENSFLLNLLILSSSTTFLLENGGNQEVLSSVSVDVAFVTFLAILVYHSYTYVVCINKLVKKARCLIGKKKPKEEKPEATKAMLPASQGYQPPVVNFTDYRGHLSSVLEVASVQDSVLTNNVSPHEVKYELQPAVKVRTVTHAVIDGIPYCEEEQFDDENSSV